MATKIKGITLEIAGDTTGLSKALSKVNKETRSLESELRAVDKALKLDPKNTELLAQKQKLLGQNVDAVKSKLQALEKAKAAADDRIAKGAKIPEEQYRALQREIVFTTQKLNKLEAEAKDVGKGIEKGAKDGGKAMDKLGDSTLSVKDAMTGAVGAITAVVGGLLAFVESTKETVEDMGKLEAAFISAGHTTETAQKAFSEMVGILGETDQSVEAVNHLAMLTKSEEELAKWTDIAAGVYAKFGDSLPLEGLTEAANETAKVGEVTGPLADALNWAGIAEDEFNEKLAECNTEQERATLITQTLSDTYKDAADAYTDVNAELIASREASAEFAIAMGNLGQSLMPIATSLTEIGTALLTNLAPALDGALEKTSSLNLSEIKTDLESISQSLDEIYVAVSPLLDKMGDSALATAVSKLGDATTIITTNLEVLSSIANKDFSFFSEIDVFNATEFSQAVIGVKDAIDLIANFNPAQFLIKGIFEDAATEAKNANGEMTEAQKNIWGWALLAAEKLLDLKEDLSQWKDDTVGYIDDLRKKLNEKAAEILEDIGNLKEKAHEIGKNILEGLWNGINDKVTWLKTQVKGVVDKIKGWFTGKDGFDTHSPSKWAEEIGKYVDEGLANGILEGIPMVRNSFGQLFSAVEGEHGHLIKGMMSSVNSQIKTLQNSLSSYKNALSKTDLFTERTTLFNFGDSSYTHTEYGLADLSAKRAELEKFKNNIAQLNALGIDEAMLEEIRELGGEEGGKLAEALLAATPEQREQFIEDYKAIGRLSGEASAEVFATEFENAALGIHEVLAELQPDILAEGETWGTLLGEGVLSTFKQSLITLGELMASYVGSGYSGNGIVNNSNVNNNSNVTIVQNITATPSSAYENSEAIRRTMNGLQMGAVMA